MIKKITIIGLILFIIGAIGGLALFSSVGLSYDLVEINEEKVIEAQDITKIEITSDVIDIFLKPTTDQTITARLVGEVKKRDQDRYQLKTNVSNHKLTVNLRTKSQFFFGLSYTSPDAEILLPEKLYDQLTIHCDTGDIEAEDLQSVGLFIETDTGDVIFNGYEGEKAEFSTDTGDVELNQFVAETVIDTDTGDIDVHLDELKKSFYMTSDTGDVDMRFNQAPTGIEVDFQSDTGDAEIDVPDMDYRVNTKHNVDGLLHVGDQYPAKIKFKSDTGDFTLTSK